MTNRKDSWNEKEDLLLAETVLRYMRLGNTMEKAFIETAKQLGRTKTACSVRWNTALRERYEMAIELAKKTIKSQPKPLKETPIPSLPKAKEETRQKYTEEKETDEIDQDLEQAVKVISKHLRKYVNMKKEFNSFREAQEEIEKLQHGTTPMDGLWPLRRIWLPAFGQVVKTVHSTSSAPVRVRVQTRHCQSMQVL